jgi:hypothetical protein
MLTPDDGRTDGDFTQYLEDPIEWRGYDAELFDHLRDSRRCSLAVTKPRHVSTSTEEL